MRARESEFSRRTDPAPSVGVFLALILLIATTCLGQEAALVDANDLPPILSGPYQVQVGDVLDISFFKTFQLNESRTVGPDGNIYLPLVGRTLGKRLSSRMGFGDLRNSQDRRTGYQARARLTPRNCSLRIGFPHSRKGMAVST